MSKNIKYMMTQLSLLIKMSLLGKELTNKTQNKKTYHYWEIIGMKSLYLL